MFKKVGESILALIIGGLAAYGLVCLYASLFADKFLFATRDLSYRTTPEYTHTLTRLGNSITLLHLVNPDAKYTILYSYGQQEDLGFVRPRLELFRKNGFNVLGYDYAGFGTSMGVRTEETLCASAQAAYDYLTETLHIPPERIILYGRSMGGGPTSYLAGHAKYAGVVLQSTFVSAYRVQTGIKLLPWDHFENLKAVPYFTAPLMVIHGLADETIPSWHSRMLAQHAKVPVTTLFVPFALHNNVVEMARDEYWTALDRFVKSIEEYSVAQALKPEATKPVAKETPEAKSVASSTAPAAVVTKVATTLPAPKVEAKPVVSAPTPPATPAVEAPKATEVAPIEATKATNTQAAALIKSPAEAASQPAPSAPAKTTPPEATK